MTMINWKKILEASEPESDPFHMKGIVEKINRTSQSKPDVKAGLEATAAKLREDLKRGVSPRDEALKKKTLADLEKMLKDYYS